MGLILDTCVLIDSERKRRTVLAMAEFIFDRTAELGVAICAVTLVELAYGITKTRDSSVRKMRELFLADVLSQIPIYPVTEAISVQAGLLDGTLEAKGVTVELADLLIGVTALHHGHQVLTNNVRHFRAVPALEVVEF